MSYNITTPLRIFGPSYGPAEVVNAIESEMQSIVEHRAERHPLTAIKYRAVRTWGQGGIRTLSNFERSIGKVMPNTFLLVPSDFQAFPLQPSALV